MPAGIEIGYDLDQDRARGFTVTDDGIVVIAKGEGVEQHPPLEIQKASSST